MAEHASSHGPLKTATGAAVGATPLRPRIERRALNRPVAHSLPFQGLVFFLGDMLVVAASSITVFYFRYARGFHVVEGISSTHYLGFLFLYAALVAIFCQNQGLYRSRRSVGPLDESFSVLKAVLPASLLLATFIYLSGDKSISRLVVGFSALLTAVTLSMWRFGEREIVTWRVASGKEGRHVLIVGAHDVGQALAQHFEENKHLGYVVKGFIDWDQGNGIAPLDNFSQLAQREFIDEVFITTPSERDVVNEIVLRAREHHLDVKVVPELFDGLGWRAPISYIGDFPVMELLREPIPILGLFIKRLVDIVGSFFALIVLSPLFAALLLIVRTDSQGPAIYQSWRVGWKGRRFACYKFRTMVANADKLKDSLRHMNERSGPFFKITNDPRLTRVGGFLRRYSLDELPQLWNVLKGEMSLVGPRPHPLDDFEKYQLEHLRRLDVRPGITGLWQVYARRDPSFERNLALDLEYIENWSLWLDTKILLKTLPAAFSGSGS